MSDEISRRPPSERRAKPEPRYQGNTRKAPFLLRFIVQVSILAIFLAAGYYGSDLLFKFLDKNNILKQEDVVSNSEDLQKLLDADTQAQGVVTPSREITVYSLGGSGLMRMTIKVMSDIMEDAAMEALKNVFSQSSEAWANVVRPRHIYRDGSTFYVDMSKGFAEGLSGMSEERALLMLTSVVRTIEENFLPGASTQIYFLQEGKWIEDAGEVKLSQAWGM